MSPLGAESLSTLTCSNCGHAETLIMATNSCLVRYECPACGAALKPKPGDCCVFCSYGDVPCPPAQRREACCREAGAEGSNDRGE